MSIKGITENPKLIRLVIVIVVIRLKLKNNNNNNNSKKTTCGFYLSLTFAPSNYLF
jgi:hypothetical protein